MSSVVPAFSARVAACAIVGPSASGSLYGTPSSMTSAPSSSRIAIARSVASRLGSPAHMNGMNAHWPRFLSAANVAPMETVLTTGRLVDSVVVAVARGIIVATARGLRRRVAAAPVAAGGGFARSLAGDATGAAMAMTTTRLRDASRGVRAIDRSRTRISTGVVRRNLILILRIPRGRMIF